MSTESERDISGGDTKPIELNLLEGGLSTENQAIEGKDFGTEWRRQSQTLARHFAKRLGLSTEEYINTLPEFEPQPENFKGILNIPVVPVIVETRIALPEMLDMLKIDSFFDPQKIQDWSEGGFKTPSEPYTTWLTYIPKKSAKEVRASLDKDQRGGAVFDGIALYLRNPRILNRYFLEFPGSQVGSDCSPFLWASPNPVESQLPNHSSLSYGLIESESPKHACVIASKV